MKDLARISFALTVLIGVASLPAQAADSGTIASSYSATAPYVYSLNYGDSFLQNFTAKEGGSPAEVLVGMGLNCRKITHIDSYSKQTAAAYGVQISIDGNASGPIASQTFSVKQDGSEANCSAKFTLTGARAMQKGEGGRLTVKFTSKPMYFNPASGKMEEGQGAVDYWGIQTANADWPLSTTNGNVALKFSIKATPLQVTATPPAGGTILWDDGSVCGTQCIAMLNAGALHTFTAQPAATYSVAAWSGICSGQTAATCTAAAAPGQQSVVANFVQLVTVTIDRPSNGTITGFCPTGCNLACGDSTSGANACSAEIPKGAAVTLTALPKSGMLWQGWGTGACTGIAAKCTLTPTTSVTVSGHFGKNAAF